MPMDMRWKLTTSWRRYLPAPFEGRRALTALFPSLDGCPRSTRKAPDNTPCLQKWRMFLDGSGVAIGALLGLEKKIMYPSDYPHERPTLEEFLADIPRFRAPKRSVRRN